MKVNKTSVRVHNDSVYLEQVQTLKRNGVPGENTLERAAYFLDHLPHIKAKDVGEIIGVATNSVHTTNWKIRNDRKTEPNKYRIEKNNNTSNVAVSESTKLEVEPPQMDIWDQEPPHMYEEPPYIPIEPQPVHIEPQPIHREPQRAQQVYIQPIIPPQSLGPKNEVVFELGMSGADGMTLRSLISVIYGKISDNRKYKVHIKIEEE